MKQKTENITTISTIGRWITTNILHLPQVKKLFSFIILLFITSIIVVSYQSKMYIAVANETHVKKTFRIIGGMPQSIDWLERGFKMDIFPDTFPANASVNITIIYHHSYPPAFNKYTLVTPNYEIESTHQPSGTAVIVHLKHNVMHRDNASFHLIHQHDDNTVTSSAIENISKYFISFKVDSFSCCCVMCSNCTIKYGASFYARKTSSHVQVQVVLNSFKDKMKDNKYSKWIKEPISPLEIHHNVTVTTEVELEPSGYGCLTKLEKHSYTMIIDDDPKEEFSFHFKWNSSCPWWDLWSSQKSSTWIDVHIKDNKPTTAMIFLEMLSVEFDLQTSLLNSPWYTIIIVPAFTVIEALIRNKLGIAN
jgi:hypothetical protein